MSKRLVAFAAVVVAVVAGAAAGELWLTQVFRARGPAATARRVQVAPGLTVRGVLDRLGAAGALAHPRLTELYLRIHRERLEVKAGAYDIPAHASAAEVVQQLAAGRVVLEQLTVVEGSRFSDFRHELATDPAVRATLRGKTDAEVMAAIGHPGEQPEGRFFPDTYRFAAGTTDVAILELAYNEMSRVLASAWTGRESGLPIHTAYQALILASIVEKETALASERPLIAGVFVSRLRKGMRLQSDPTVIYGMGSRYDGDIRSRDLVTDTPYNTYTRAGLPPTPICLPGRASILAAVRPEVTGALYFVATGDPDGSHDFSATLRQHDVALRKYLSRLRAEGLMPGESRVPSHATRSTRRTRSAHPMHPTRSDR
ncbi:MAG: endolytic transglycosylase MltG [Steroidobacteraceae bacterium]